MLRLLAGETYLHKLFARSDSSKEDGKASPWIRGAFHLIPNYCRCPSFVCCFVLTYFSQYDFWCFAARIIARESQWKKGWGLQLSENFLTQRGAQYLHLGGAEPKSLSKKDSTKIAQWSGTFKVHQARNKGKTHTEASLDEKKLRRVHYNSVQNSRQVAHPWEAMRLQQ